MSGKTTLFDIYFLYNKGEKISIEYTEGQDLYKEYERNGYCKNAILSPYHYTKGDELIAEINIFTKAGSNIFFCELCRAGYEIACFAGQNKYERFSILEKFISMAKDICQIEQWSKQLNEYYD